MTTGKNPDFVIIDEVHSLVEADFAEIEKRILSDPQIQDQFFSAMSDLLDAKPLSEEPPKASDFIDPTIKKAVLTMASKIPIYRGMDLGTEFHPNGRPKFKAPEPDKRAKAKAARKQRRKQK